MIIAGPLAPIEEVLEDVLVWLHTTVGLSWAWSIVATTVIVRTLLLPLTVRQIHSMQRIQVHAPEMKALQQKYKNDRQRLNEELMKFYKEKGINPASSCLPILFQIPIFFALFFVLRDFSKEIFPRFPASPLGWLDVVPDITDPLREDVLSAAVLMVVYVVSQTASTWFMSTTMDRMQRWLLLALPLVFVFFIPNFPAGLVLYWVTTNLWTTGQGLVTRRLMPKAPPPEKRSSRTPPRAEAPPARAEEAKPAPQQPMQVRKVKRKKKKARR